MGQKEGPDCTDRCRSTQHGDIITAAISRRSVSDFDLCSYLNFICNCCESVKDSVGRTALHVAASCGRIDLVRWLVQNRHSSINTKDNESGFTALHRSIFYGKLNVAIELIKLGADTTVLDSNSLTMLEHALVDGYIPENTDSGELYAWGTNCSNSLGPHQSQTVPELMDVFHKKFLDESVAKIYIDKFHSVIVSSSGRVYSCGHGQGGRLGLGHLKTVVAPELVHFPEPSNSSEPVLCVDAAIARDHSIFLCSDLNIYACGLNTNRVLGLNSAPQQLLTPTFVKHVQGVIGVCAGQYHSVAWGPNCIYTWGLNAGQLGHKMRTDDKFITTPKTVALDVTSTRIIAVDSSDGAITVYTAKGDIYVLHEYQCRKIASRQLNIVQVSVFGGKLNVSVCKEILNEPKRELKIIALTNTGNLLLWQESDQQLCRCIFSLNRPIIVKQVIINSNGLLFVTRNGEAFQGFIKPRKKKPNNTTSSHQSVEKSAFHKFLDRDDCISIKLTKFPRIYRALNIKSDAKANDFCVIQAPPYKRFDAPNIIESEMKNNLGRLLNECHENDDLHDVVFKVENKYFPAHRFVIASQSSYFEKLFLDDNSCSDRVIDLNSNNNVSTGFSSLIFEQFLLFIYTGTCDLLKCGECPEKFKNLCSEKQKDLSSPPVSEEEMQDGRLTSAFQVYTKAKNNKTQELLTNQGNKIIKNPIRMLHEMAKKFACNRLCNILSNYEMQKFVIKKKSSKNDLEERQCVRFNRSNPAEFYDVTIKCSDGKEVKAHKCILAARTDYFNSLFSTRWSGNESSVITLPCTRRIVEALLEYLYTDRLSYLNNKDQDHLFKLIILADQLFIERLKEHCEFLLYHCLTLKNSVQFLTFANIYNAENLKNSCLKFIISNISPLLELRLFDELDEELLKELSEFYFEQKSEIWCRVITPYSTAPLEEEILSVSSIYPVSLDEEVVKNSSTSTQKRRPRTHRNSTNIENNSKVLVKDEIEENVIQFPDSPDVNCNIIETIIPNRLKSIRLACERLDEDYDSQQSQFTKLVSQKNTSSSSFEDFPLLNSSPTVLTSGNSGSYGKSPHSKHKMLKVSQKERKRLLSSENSPEPVTVQESPKNPWKIITELNTSSSSLETSMNEIISSEKKQKENLVKITSKLLIYTQIEDKAIEDLRKFYNTDNENDEIITVSRVEMGPIAAPVWVPGVKKLDAM